MSQSIAEDASPAAVVEPLSPGVISALRHRDLRLFLSGAFVSNLGTWLQSTALSWLILEITGSATWLATVPLAQFGPMLVLGVAGGVAADRFSRRHILLITQSTMLAIAVGMAIIALTDNARLAVVLPLVTLSGCALAFNAPAFQAFISDLVPRDHVPVAVALNSSQFSVSRVIGPAAAGWLLHLTGDTSAGVLRGVSIAFSINAVTFMAVIVALSLVKPAVHERSSKISFESFTIAFRTAKEIPVIKSLVAVAIVLSFLSAPIMALLPLVAKSVLHSGAAVYGQLLAAFGLGTAGGSLLSSRFSARFGYKKVVVAGTFLQAALLGVFSVTTIAPAALVLVMALGAIHGTVIASTNSGLQLATPARRRGRVMSLFLMSFAGLYPMGALVGGLLADRLGTPRTLGMAAVLVGMAGIGFWKFASDLAKVSHR